MKNVGDIIKESVNDMGRSFLSSIDEQADLPIEANVRNRMFTVPNGLRGRCSQMLTTAQRVREAVQNSYLK